MKKKKKIFFIIFIEIILLCGIGIFLCFYRDEIKQTTNNNLSDNLENTIEYNKNIDGNGEIDNNIDLINIEECSENFMQEYFEDNKKINNKDNVLIVSSKEKIEDAYGAINIVEAPNNQYFIEYDSKEEKNKALEQFEQNSEVLYVEENHVYNIFESEYNSWGIEKIGLNQAVKKANSMDTNEVTVAIIDTGCDMEIFNKNYSGKIIETYNVLVPGGNMVDEEGHGTHIAGTIAEGTPDNVKILPVKVARQKELYNSDIIAGINYIVYNKKADVINMSFGGIIKDLSMLDAINAANKANIICVAAAGNEGTSVKNYPAAFDSTISISACDSNLKFWNYSSYGDTVTFCAPGANILSINGTKSGTSMATPHAVSAVAILKSFNIDYTLEDVTEILKTYAIDLGDAGKDIYYGYGLINLGGIIYCSCDCEVCDSIYCKECNCEECVFKNKETNIVKKIEVQYPLHVGYDYGSITNLSSTTIKIYFDEKNYYIKYLLELEDCEIIGYNPYSYTIQNITVKYKGQETTFKFDNSGKYKCGWEYEIIDEVNKLIRLTQYKETTYDLECIKNIKNLYIPQTLDGYTVTSLKTQLFNGERFENINLPYTITEIGTNAFYNCKNLKEIVIPEKVTQIESATFYGCVMLRRVVLPSSIEKIGENTFYECRNLKNITIPENVSSIGKYAFFNNINLKNIVIPSGVTQIDIGTFAGCSSLESVTISKSVTVIGDYAFEYCTNLNSIYIPKNVSNIGIKAFKECISLESVIVDKENECYDSRDNANAIIETKTNKLLVGSYNTKIPNTIKVIGEYAFYGNLNLMGIIIPEGVEEINDYAFYECIGLKQIKIPRSVISIGQKVFGAITGSDYITIWVCKDSYAKKYAEQNNLNYKYTDVSKIWVNLDKKQYQAFEVVDTKGMYIGLLYEDGSREFIDEGIEIKYINANKSFRYGDTYFTVSAYTEAGEYIEHQVAVTVTKAIPNYILPTNLEAKPGQKLSEIKLSNGFEWMDANQIVEGSGNVVYKAKYTPDDTINYEVVENIEISILVKGIQFEVYLEYENLKRWMLKRI